jgi:hypothetical protein
LVQIPVVVLAIVLADTLQLLFPSLARERVQVRMDHERTIFEELMGSFQSRPFSFDLVRTHPCQHSQQLAIETVSKRESLSSLANPNRSKRHVTRP